MSHPTATALNIAILSFIGIVVPFLSWAAWFFYRNKNHQIMSYRDPAYVLTVAFFVIIGLIFASIPRVLDKMDMVIYSDSIIGLINTMITYAILFLFCLKSYLLFFQQRYHSAIQNAAWKSQIDKNHEQTNFYITNKQKWGSFCYVVKWLSIPYSWIFIIELVSIFDVPEWVNTVALVNKIVFASIPIFLFIFLTYRLGEFYDVYGIKKEIFGQFLCTVVVFVGYGLISAATSSSHDGKEIQASIGIGVFVLIYCVFGVTSVYHPIHLIKQENRKHAALHLQQQNSQSNTIAGFLEVLKDERIFSLFMQHLVKEFATENLLFIAELTQIKHYYLLAQHNVLKISNKRGQLNKQDSLSVQNGKRTSLDNMATSSRIDDRYLAIDFNACIYDHSGSSEDNGDNTTISPTSPDEDSNHHKLTNLALSPSTSNAFSRTMSIMEERSRHILTYFMNDTSTYDMLQLEIPSKLPTSSLVSSFPQDLYPQMKGLYEKYVKVGSNFEINIPYQLREDVEMALNHYHDSAMGKTHPSVQMIEGDLFWIMDDACLNIFRLLLAPFRRFKIGEKYQKYITSMEHQAKSANFEFTQIVQQQVTSSKPKIHAGHSYDRLSEYYQKR